jgi:aminopeptidase
MDAFSALELEAYAQVVVAAGVQLQPGQRLCIRAPLAAAPLVRVVANHAYQAGARLVYVLWEDDALRLARFAHAPRDSFAEFPDWLVHAHNEAIAAGDALLGILGTDPRLLDDHDPALVNLEQQTADQRLAAFWEQVFVNATNWCGIGYPVPGWAQRVFPDLPSDQAVAKLGATIAQTMRLDQQHPVQAWHDHAAQLVRRRAYLNAKRYAALHFRGPGTDLIVGLADGHTWAGGSADTLNGGRCIANMPTEEVFTTPHHSRVNGVVALTRPRSQGGMLIEEAVLRFADGAVVAAHARHGEAVLQHLLASDPGASRLGEVALVAASSLVARSNLLFYNILFDENAASHIAIGAAYPFTMEGFPTTSFADMVARGMNQSQAHADLMIGSDEMDVDGLTQTGEAEPLMRAGEWTTALT